MALVVAVVFCVFAVILRLAGSDKVDVLPFRGLELVPQLGAPADDFCNRVAKRHVADRGVCLSGCCAHESGEGEELDGDHFGRMEKLLCFAVDCEDKD